MHMYKRTQGDNLVLDGDKEKVLGNILIHILANIEKEEPTSESEKELLRRKEGKEKKSPRSTARFVWSRKES